VRVDTSPEAKRNLQVGQVSQFTPGDGAMGGCCGLGGGTPPGTVSPEALAPNP